MKGVDLKLTQNRLADDVVVRKKVREVQSSRAPEPSYRAVAQSVSALALYNCGFFEKEQVNRLIARPKKERPVGIRPEGGCTGRNFTVAPFR